MKFYYSEFDGLEVFRNIRDRGEVRAAIKLPYRVFPKTEYSENSTDVFGSAALKAWYSADDIIVGVQVYYPEGEFYFLGGQLLGVSVNELEVFLIGLGVGMEYEADKTGVNIKNNTVRFYAPDFGECGKRAKIEAVYLTIPGFTG
ncbi:hypothetical protein D3C86_1575640 [compost metagenome]